MEVSTENWFGKSMGRSKRIIKNTRDRIVVDGNVVGFVLPCEGSVPVLTEPFTDSDAQEIADKLSDHYGFRLGSPVNPPSVPENNEEAEQYDDDFDS